MPVETKLESFLEELASSSPAPGGGSVAALASALGCALTAMVCRLTIGKKKYLEVQPEMEIVLQEAENLRRKATRLIDEDTEAFGSVMEAFALPAGNEQEKLIRQAAIEESTKKATLVPLQVMKLVGEAGVLVKAVAERGNRNSITDAGVAVLMLQAACEGARLNVAVNLSGLNDGNFIQTVTDEFREIAAQVKDLLDSVRQIVLGRLAEMSCRK